MWGAWSAVKRMLVWMLQWFHSKVVVGVHGGTPKRTPTMKNSVLMESASSLANRIRSQKVTSVEVVQSYIDRIQEVNEVLNCVVDERFKAALAEAREADDAIRSGVKTTEEFRTKRPLLGVPFTSPEAVAVQGLSHTMGIAARKGETAKADASAVALMRAAGAIPVACTNVSEGCFLWETNNPVFGKTCNPYDTNRSVGGPFGGEGCVIAACGSPLGIAPRATVPSAFNGIFGHKPSENTSCDGAGPVSRNSADLLPALKILTKNSTTDLLLDEPVDLKRLTYYFMDGDNGNSPTSPVDEEIKGKIQKAVHHFRNVINASVERLDLKQIKDAYAMWKNQKQVPRGRGDQVSLCKELVKALFGKSHHTLIFLLASLSERTLHSNKQSRSEQLAQDHSQLLKTFQDLLGSNAVFIYPTHPTTAIHHNDSFAKESDFGYAAIFDSLGLPATHCPTGLHSDGLPIGFQVVAALNQDRLTVAVAQEIDRALGGWTPPPTHGTFTLRNTLFHSASDEKFKVL